MQFMITAYDGTDDNALERRMAVRPQHLANMAKVKENAGVLCAGGILNDEGNPVGSFLIMDFENRGQLDAYLASEPYVTGNVWQNIKTEACSVVILNGEKVGK